MLLKYQKLTVQQVCNYDGKMVERITLILERRDGQCSVEMLKK